MSVSLDERTVWLAHVPDARYGTAGGDLPELPGFEPTSSAVALRTVLLEAGLDLAHAGTPAWNPFGDLIRPGDSVVVKPNWVTHANGGAHDDWECLVTHPSLVEAICRYVLKAGPRRLTIGDAPVQGCDFDRLLDRTGTRAALARLPAGDTCVDVRDFRLVNLDEDGGYATRASATRTPADYVCFDLAGDSLLDPITRADRPFRVTMYDPKALDDTHGPGRHRYLVAREIVEADLVVNVPKLKTHKKAGLTGALKNLVGINGHKAYLPHHRKGGGAEGGDAYPGRSSWKAWAEETYDTANRLQGGTIKAALFRSAAAMERASVAIAGAAPGVEGSWHGNDTVWRMSLDLQRLVVYGRLDGALDDRPQRAILSITDAVIAGQGEGPLAPDPCPLGVVTLGANPAAVEWVHAELMRLDPARIPIVARAFDAFRFPIAPFAPGDVRVRCGGLILTPQEAGEAFGRPFTPPQGWRGHCEHALEAAR